MSEETGSEGTIPTPAGEREANFDQEATIEERQAGKQDDAETHRAPASDVRAAEGDDSEDALKGADVQSGTADVGSTEQSGVAAGSTEENPSAGDLGKPEGTP